MHRLVLIIILLLVTPVLAGDFYYSGKVIDVSGNTLTVDNKTYRIANNCRIAIHLEDKGAFYEKPATFKDLRLGGWVTIRTDGRSVTEILIKGYKK